MKKYFFGIITGIFICGIVGVEAVNYLYQADEVSYTPSDTNWNVDNVDSALKDLYIKVDESDSSSNGIKYLNYDGFLRSSTVTATDDGVFCISGNGGSGATVTVNGKTITAAGSLYSVSTLYPCKKNDVIKTNYGTVTFIPYDKSNYVIPYELDYANKYSGTSYTAPKDGFVQTSTGGNGDGIKINNNAIVVNNVYSGGSVLFPVKKGDVIARYSTYGSIVYIPTVD